MLLNLDEFEDIYSELIDYFINCIEEAQLKGSGFKFINIVKTRLKIIEVNQLRGSSYIDLPFKNRNILNIQNTNDNKCFIYSVLAYIHKIDSKDHPQRPIKYIKYEKELNMDGIEYPVKLKDIKKFESQNPDINIYVFALPDKNKPKESKEYFSGLYNIYKTKYPEGNKVIDLLYIEQDGNSHYCLIKNLNGLLSKNKKKSHICRNCMMPLSRQEALKNHQELCLLHKTTRKAMHSKEKKIIEFNNFHYMSRLPFAFYADFEAISIPIQSVEDDPKKSNNEKNYCKKQLAMAYI